METRIKQSKELIWVTGGIFFGMVILSIFVHGAWELAVFFGILLVVGLILYYLDKDNDLIQKVIQQRNLLGTDFPDYMFLHRTKIATFRQNSKGVRPADSSFGDFVIKKKKRTSTHKTKKPALWMDDLMVSKKMSILSLAYRCNYTV